MQIIHIFFAFLALDTRLETLIRHKPTPAFSGTGTLSKRRAMDHHDAMVSYACNGAIWHGDGGSWIGHMLPGLIFLAWGAHTALASFTKYIIDPSSYHAASFWPFFGSLLLPMPSRTAGTLLDLLEPALKVIGPPIAMLFELWLGHPQYRCDVL